MLSRILAALLLVLVAFPVVGEEKKEGPKKLVPTAKIEGSVADEKLETQAPRTGFLANAKEFEALWKAWMLDEKAMPKVDFTKELVLVATTRGSRLILNPSVDDKGDLKALAISTRDLRDGFRYTIQVVSREGVKTVNGKELKN